VRRQISACGGVLPTSAEVRRGRPPTRHGLRCTDPMDCVDTPDRLASRLVRDPPGCSDSGSLTCTAAIPPSSSASLSGTNPRDGRPGAVPNGPSHQLTRDIGVPRRGTLQPFVRHTREFQDSLPRTKGGRDRYRSSPIGARAPSVARSAPHPRHPPAGRRCGHQNRVGALGSRVGGVHARHLRPRATGQQASAAAAAAALVEGWAVAAWSRSGYRTPDRCGVRRQSIFGLTRTSGGITAPGPYRVKRLIIGRSWVRSPPGPRVPRWSRT
jgi:hypothetical protein